MERLDTTACRSDRKTYDPAVMHRTMWEYDADSHSDGGVKCRSAHSALLIAFAWARRILSSPGCFARYCQLERPGSLSTQSGATPLSPWEGAEAKGNPFRKSSLVQVVSVGKKKIGQLCKSTFAYGAALPLIPDHVYALTRLPPQPESLSGPVLNPICSVTPTPPPSAVKDRLPMSITGWWMGWKVVTPLSRVHPSHQPCRHLQIVMGNSAEITNFENICRCIYCSCFNVNLAACYH